MPIKKLFRVNIKSFYLRQRGLSINSEIYGRNNAPLTEIKVKLKFSLAQFCRFYKIHVHTTIIYDKICFLVLRFSVKLACDDDNTYHADNKHVTPITTVPLQGKVAKLCKSYTMTLELLILTSLLGEDGGQIMLTNALQA